MERTKVGDPLPDASDVGGVGVVVQVEQQTGIDGRLTLLDTTIERSRDVGSDRGRLGSMARAVTIIDTAADAAGGFGCKASSANLTAPTALPP